MQFFSLSVRTLVILILTASLCSFNIITPTTMLEGKWDCGSKSGQLDENVSYQLNCAGNVLFKADHTVVSTTTDAFFPSGSKWMVESNKLVLSDSYGVPFISFEIKHLETNQLVLSRKDVDYGFVRSN